jgi:hypothetical protein
VIDIRAEIVATAANEAALSTPRRRCWSVGWASIQRLEEGRDGARRASTHRPLKKQYGPLQEDSQLALPACSLDQPIGP